MKITKINDIGALAKVLEKPESILFKNSKRCPVSSFARKEFEKFAEQKGINIDLFMIDIIENRDVSTEFAEKTEIKHESPQVCYIKNGTVIWHESHMSITCDNINEIVKKVTTLRKVNNHGNFTEKNKLSGLYNLIYCVN